MRWRGAQSPNGARAIVVTVASALVGAGYYGYLVGVDFPPAAVRFIPVAWLALALLAARFALAAVQTDARRALGVAAALLAVPNVGLAVLFTLAALLGD